MSEEEDANGGAEAGAVDLGEDDAGIFDQQGAMHPDHPLLIRAQEALKTQLLKTRTALGEEVREKARSLKVGTKTWKSEHTSDLYLLHQATASHPVKFSH